MERTVAENFSIRDLSRMAECATRTLLMGFIVSVCIHSFPFDWNLECRNAEKTVSLAKFNIITQEVTISLAVNLQLSCVPTPLPVCSSIMNSTQMYLVQHPEDNQIIKLAGLWQPLLNFGACSLAHPIDKQLIVQVCSILFPNGVSRKRVTD